MIRAERKYKQRSPGSFWKAPQCHQSPIEAVVHRVMTRVTVLRNYSPHGSCTHSVRPLPHSTDPCLTLCSSVGLDSSHHQQSQTAKRHHQCSQHQKDNQRLQKHLIHALPMKTQEADQHIQEQTSILKGTIKKGVLINSESWAGLV